MSQSRERSTQHTMNTNERIRQINLVPSYENGSWVVREQSFRLDGIQALDIEETKVWHFTKRKFAEAFIKRWRKNKGNI